MSSPKDLNSPSPWNMRIWDEEKSQWLCDGEDDVLPYYGFDIRGGEVTAMQSMDWVYRQFEHGRKLIWERSTGLTDKNGKEIYEGDIVKYGDSVAVIIWREENAEFGVRWLDCGVEDSISWQAGVEETPSEVIGNIHEKDKLVDFDHVTGGEE